jgi:hypothetical protein
MPGAVLTTGFHETGWRKWSAVSVCAPQGSSTEELRLGDHRYEIGFVAVQELRLGDTPRFGFCRIIFIQLSGSPSVAKLCGACHAFADCCCSAYLDVICNRYVMGWWPWTDVGKKINGKVMRFCYAYLILHRFVRGTISPNPTAPPSHRLFPRRRTEPAWGYWVCGHRVLCHRLTGTFVACNSRYLKSWVANFLEGPFWTNVDQTKYYRDFPCSEPIAVPHVSISPFYVSSSVSICVAIRCNGVTPQRCTVKIYFVSLPLTLHEP